MASLHIGDDITIVKKNMAVPVFLLIFWSSLYEISKKMYSSFLAKFSPKPNPLGLLLSLNHTLLTISFIKVKPLFSLFSKNRMAGSVVRLSLGS